MCIIVFQNLVKIENTKLRVLDVRSLARGGCQPRVARVAHVPRGVGLDVQYSGVQAQTNKTSRFNNFQQGSTRFKLKALLSFFHNESLKLGVVSKPGSS